MNQKNEQAQGSALSGGLGAATDPWYQHEAIDRCHVINCMIGDHLESHPFVAAHPEIQALILEASRSLGEAYQKIGQIDLG